MTTRLMALLVLLPLTVGAPSRAQDPTEERFGKGKITISNGTSVPVVAWFGKVELGPIAANGTQTFEKIPVGTRLMHVIADNRERRWGPKDLYVTEGGTTWTITEGATTGMVVTNNTAEDLIIYVSDEESGKAPAGGTFKILDVRVGNLKVSAKTASGKASYQPRFFEIKDAKMAEWKIGRAAAPAATPAATPAPAK